ncbi:hypothetical protein os1_21660 [Comamonadaceae bacterium OS-1]|nr:hypothetical protein os1_21660 [Comamonadaceae bacterium OS-1]
MTHPPSFIVRASKEFSTIRRQKFMYWEAYEAIEKTLSEFDVAERGFIEKATDLEKKDLGYVGYFNSLFEQVLDRISLEYTCGATMEECKALYPAAVDAFEAWCIAFRDWHYREFPESKDVFIPNATDPKVGEHYLNLLRLLSLGALFNEGAQLRRIAYWISAFRAKDGVVEALLFPFVPDTSECSTLYHLALYDDLLGAAWEDPAESAQCMGTFLKGWYKYYKNASWHGAHLRFGNVATSPDWAGYYGYWAWEAAAVAYLYEQDDSSYRDHLVYPKDIVAWARQQGPVPKTYTPPSSTEPSLSALPGQPCPKAGLWYAPHLRMREVRMELDEPMPGVGERGVTGAVTWYYKGLG